jgi:hypothetical protein
MAPSSPPLFSCVTPGCMVGRDSDSLLSEILVEDCGEETHAKDGNAKLLKRDGGEELMFEMDVLKF